jgi:hypothetical protein
MRDGLAQRTHAHRARSGSRCLGGILLRTDHLTDAARDGAAHAGQNPAHAAHPAVERELAEAESADLDRQLIRRAQHSQRDGQIEAAALLLSLRWREVGDDAPQRELEAGVAYRRAHPLARFRDRGVRKTDDVEVR